MSWGIYWQGFVAVKKLPHSFGFAEVFAVHYGTCWSICPSLWHIRLVVLQHKVHATAAIKSGPFGLQESSWQDFS